MTLTQKTLLNPSVWKYLHHLECGSFQIDSCEFSGAGSGTSQDSQGWPDCPEARELETRVTRSPAKQEELALLVEIAGLSVGWSKAERKPWLG